MFKRIRYFSNIPRLDLFLTKRKFSLSSYLGVRITKSPDDIRWSWKLQDTAFQGWDLARLGILEFCSQYFWQKFKESQKYAQCLKSE